MGTAWWTLKNSLNCSNSGSYVVHGGMRHCLRSEGSVIQHVTTMYDTWLPCMPRNYHVCHVTSMYATWLPCMPRDYNVWHVITMYDTWLPYMTRDYHIRQYWVRRPYVRQRDNEDNVHCAGRVVIYIICRYSSFVNSLIIIVNGFNGAVIISFVEILTFCLT